MDRKQIEAAFDELEAENPLERARVWLKATDEGGGTVSIVVDKGDYDMFMEEELFVTRYEYDNGRNAELFKEPFVRHIGANFVPFDSILLVELMTEVFPDEHSESHDGLDPSEYVVGTFEPEDVEWRVEPRVLEYVKEHGLMDSVVMGTVKRMRDWYDNIYSDAASEFMRYALRDAIGREKLEELEA